MLSITLSHSHTLTLSLSHTLAFSLYCSCFLPLIQYFVPYPTTNSAITIFSASYCFSLTLSLFLLLSFTQLPLPSISNSIAMNEVPAAWTAVAYPSMKPCSAWSEELLDRLQFIQGDSLSWSPCLLSRSQQNPFFMIFS